MSVCIRVCICVNLCYIMTKEKPIYKRIRKRWAINPRTRVKRSKKLYKRSKNKRKLQNEIDMD